MTISASYAVFVGYLRRFVARAIVIGAALLCGRACLAGEAATGAAEAGSRPTLAVFMARLAYTRIPLNRGDDHELFATGKLAGRKTTFYIDSGWGLTALDAAHAAEFPRLDGRLFTLVDTFLGKLEGPELVALPVVELESARFLNQPARLMNLGLEVAEAASLLRRPALRTFTEEARRLEVILGCDFYSRTRAVLDPRGSSLFVRDDAPSAKISEVLEASLRASGFDVVRALDAYPVILVVQVGFGDRTANLLVDTGSPYTILNRSHAQTLRLGLVDGPGLVYGVAGRTTDLQAARVRRLRLGNWEGASVVIGVADLTRWFEEEALSKTVPIHGLLGMDVILRSSALIDFHHRRLFARSEVVSEPTAGAAEQ